MTVTVEDVTPAVQVSDVRWVSPTVDVSAEITFLGATVTLSEAAVGDTIRWRFFWPVVDANCVQQDDARTLRGSDGGYTLVKEGDQYFLDSFGLLTNSRTSYTPGTSRRLFIGPFISGTSAPRHPGRWEGQIIHRDSATGEEFLKGNDFFLLVGHVAQKLPGVDEEDGEPASGDGQVTHKVSEPLAKPFVVQVIRNDAQPGNITVNPDGTFSGTPKPGVQVTFSIISQPTDALGASLSVTTTTTDADGLARTVLTLGDQPGAYSVRATVQNPCNSPNLTFMAELREVNYLRLRIEPTDVLVEPGSRADPVIFGISSPSAPSRQDVTAMGFYKGADGREDTADDIALGPVEADWVLANGAKNEATIVGAGAAGVSKRATVTLDAGTKVGTSKLKVSFIPNNATRPTARGTFNVEIVEVAFLVEDAEGSIDESPDTQDASGVDLESVEVRFNETLIERTRWEDLVTDFQEGRAAFPTGKVIRFGPRFEELLRGPNLLKVEAKDIAGNELAPENKELTFDFPQVPVGALPTMSRTGGDR